jgi:hypothetical protein
VVAKQLIFPYIESDTIRGFHVVWLISSFLPIIENLSLHGMLLFISV